MNSPKKKDFKNTIIGVLLLGILASALWEKIISPLSDFIFIQVSNTFSFLYQHFSDGIYRRISEGFNDGYSLFILLEIFIYTLLLGTYILKIPRNTKELLTSSDSTPHPVKSKYDLFNKRWFLYLLILIASLLLFYAIGKLQFIQSSKTKTLSNIEIISPYISDIEYKTLKSNFYSISKKDDFDELTKVIQSIADANNVRLK